MLNNKRHSELLLKLSQGTITEKERWELERASLDDAFLADALEGYYDNKESHDVEILASNLTNPKSPKHRKLIVRWMSIAASLLVLVAISIWSFNQLDSNSNRDTIVKVEASEQILENQNNNDFDGVKVGDVEIEDQEEALYLDEEREADKIVTTSDVQKDIKADISKRKKEYVTDKKETNSARLKSKVQQPTVVTNANKDADLKGKNAHRPPVQMMEAMDDISAVEVKLVSGVVKDVRGYPIKNALIKAETGAQETRTDEEGNFELALSEEVIISASAEGFTSQKFRSKAKLDIELEDASDLLSEKPKTLAEMMPLNKLRSHYKDSLNKYFKRNPITNCNSEFRTKRKIRLVLLVSEYNIIDDIKILDSVSQQCQLAIENAIDRASQQNMFEGSKAVKVELEITQI